MIKLCSKKFLIVAPHIDDETIGCGGTIAKAKNNGAKVYVIIMSVGDLKHFAKNLKEAKKEQRINELEKVMKYLKVDDYEILISDNEKYMRLDTIPRKDLVYLIEQSARLSLEKIKPDFFIFPTPSSHQDHKATFEACFTSARPHLMNKKWVPKIVLAYEGPQSVWSEECFHPNFYIEISDYLDKKLKAYSMYKSQIPPSPHPNSIENIKNLALVRGAEIGFFAAESFQCFRFII